MLTIRILVLSAILVFPLIRGDSILGFSPKPDEFSANRILLTNKEDGILAHWTFDEGDGNIISDSSSYDKSGTVYGASWTKGAVNGALDFDGIDDYVQIPDYFSLPPSHLASLGEGSISVWFRCDSIPTDYGIMPIFYYGAYDPCLNIPDAANQGLIIEVGHNPIHPESKRIYFTIFAEGCMFPSFCFDSAEAVTEGEWHHFVAVVGEDYNTGYLDGQELIKRNYNFGDSSYSQFFADVIKHETLWIGRGYWNGNTVFFDGAIDDIRIYNRPLSASEVQELYNNQQTYTLSVIISPPGGGTVRKEPDKTSYDSGEKVSLTPTANKGYIFERWSGDIPQDNQLDNPLSVTMDSDKNITANFHSGTADSDGTIGKNPQCFIATAAYCSPSHPHVKILRCFRERYLMSSGFGRALVDFYYKNSPFVADLIAGHELLRVAARVNLIPLVVFSYSMLHFGPTITVALLFFAFALLILFVKFYKRKTSIFKIKKK
ncbi:MAG: hypothetical protein GTO16_00295 [Candidatus Aminicenantes bacterium]|nr:hypothetical protein [Candidatus Aminicenantes bacterium]